MFAAYLFLLLASGNCLNLAVSQQFLSWSEEHAHCSLNLPAEDHLPSHLFTQGDGNWALESKKIHCEDLPYVDYFRKLLIQSPTEYHHAVAEAVLNLYKDLIIARQPTTLDAEQIRKNLPNYLKTVNATDMRILIHPISFGIPMDTIVSHVPPKAKPFGRVIPGDISTYFHLYNESLYYADMKRSLFVITYKKAGWDCLRHYEILATGSLPLFVNIKHCPQQALSIHPKSLYKLILKFPGLEINAHKTKTQVYAFDKLSLEMKRFDRRLYSALTSALLYYTRNVLSTKAIAQYVLNTMYKNSHGLINSPHPKSILYLTHKDHDMDKGDYMTDFLLHGLQEILGQKTILDFPSRDCLYKHFPLFNESNYLAARMKMYGMGFSYGAKIDVFAGTIDRNMEEVKQNIIGRKYDIIILGSGHRDGWASKLFFWDLVCKHYHRLEVGFVDGGDDHLARKVLDRYAPCAGHLFSREGYSMTITKPQG